MICKFAFYEHSCIGFPGVVLKWFVENGIVTNAYVVVLGRIKQEWKDRQLDNWKRSFEHYTWALDNEIAKETARAVLPLQTATKMYMNGTIRSWIHYINLRTANGTQKEHMDLALMCKNIFIKQLPTISEALEWNVK